MYFLMYTPCIQQCNTVKHMVLLGMGLALSKGLFTWREEDTSVWKILEAETTRSEWSPSGKGKQDEIVGL